MNPHNHSPHVMLYNIMVVTHYKQVVCTLQVIQCSHSTHYKVKQLFN